MGNQQSEGRIHSSSSWGIQEESAHEELYVRKEVLGNRQSGDRIHSSSSWRTHGSVHEELYVRKKCWKWTQWRQDPYQQQ